jgi:hypothetical protein
MCVDCFEFRPRPADIKTADASRSAPTTEFFSKKKTLCFSPELKNIKVTIDKESVLIDDLVFDHVSLQIKYALFFERAHFASPLGKVCASLFCVPVGGHLP